MDFENTNLWRRTLGPAEDGQHEAIRERLRSAYRRFWSNTTHLISQINKDLPGLTLHDASHLEALWDRADQIAGPDLALTPLEGFALGGAILLHDAGNTAAAYPGGLSEIKATPEWRDSVAAIGTASPDEEQLQTALLTTLRSLHARQAETLGSLSIKNTKTGTTSHLIEDDQLRIHLSSIVGQIAASHHWDIDQLDQRLPRQIGALAGFPRQWTIRPVLIACLLRCSDALQIDQSRTPDFLMALLQLRGMSELHWRAQNYLTAPLVDPDDPKAVIFASSKPYREEDADAWWIAFDAIRQAHTELQNCGVLLQDLRLPSFAVDRIRHAESPARLSTTVRTLDWRPISAEVKANRVARLIDMFGGEQL